MEDESDVRYTPSGSRGFHPPKNESFSPVRGGLRDSDEKMSPGAVSLKVVPRKNRRALVTGAGNKSEKNDYMV